MQLIYLVTLLMSCVIGGAMLCAGLFSLRKPELVHSSFLRIYERGARHALHPEVAARSSALAASGMGLGMLLCTPLIFLPWPHGLLLFFPLWIPILGGVIGYTVAWRFAQMQARQLARARGELSADLTPRHPGRYLKRHYFFTPWLLVLSWTTLLIILLSPLLGQPTKLPIALASVNIISLSWLDLLFAPGVAIVVILVSWLLFNMIARSPRALPMEDLESGAFTDDIMRQEATSQVHAGLMGTLLLLLLGPTTLIPDKNLNLFLIIALILGTLGLLSAPTLLRKAIIRTKTGSERKFEG